MKKFLVLSVAVFLFISFIIYYFYKDAKVINDFSRAYPRVYLYDSIDDIVIFKDKPNENFVRYSSTVTHLKFKSGFSGTIMTYRKEDQNIDDIVQINDRVLKKSGNDTILIIKPEINNKNNVFIFKVDTVRY